MDFIFSFQSKCKIGLTLLLWLSPRLMAMEIPAEVVHHFDDTGSECLKTGIPTTNTVTLSANQMTSAGINSAIHSKTTINLPAGIYNMTSVVYISGCANVILRGAVDSAGKPATELRFTKSLTNLFGNNPSASGGFGNWHGMGGLITIGMNESNYKDAIRTRPSNAIGLENLIISFNRLAYNNHREDGYNAIYLACTNDCYVKNVNLVNFDSGIITYRTKHFTATNMVLDAAEKSAHFGIVLSWSNYNLVEHINSVSGIVHDMSVQGAVHNKFSHITCVTGAHDGISFRGLGCNDNFFDDVSLGDSTSKGQYHYTRDTIVFGTSNGQPKRDPQVFGVCYYNNVSFLGTIVTEAPSYLKSKVSVYYSLAAPEPVH